MTRHALPDSPPPGVPPMGTYTVVARVPEALNALRELTADVAWVHDPRVRSLFAEVDPVGAHQLGLDPIALLARVPQSRLDELAADAVFRARAAAALDAVRADDERSRWFSHRSDTPLAQVAYFSPEFGLAASIPQYSGGLGILAGDHLKAAADLGVPLAGFGLFYRHGYFRQQLDAHGHQDERFPSLFPEAMTMTREDHTRVEVPLPSGDQSVSIWKVRVGGVSLYLLDTDTDPDAEPDQLVNDRLYGGGTAERIRQEILLGVGGYRAMRALGFDPQVIHLNEGHAGFLALELIRDLMQGQGLDYESAVEAARPHLLFTTHTPVPAGIDRFPRDLIEQHLGWWCEATGRSLDQLMELGHEPEGEPGVFNLAHMSLHLTGAACGVSRLHGHVSRAMFSEIWPTVPEPDVPIGSITNGVHARTWTSPEIDTLLSGTIGPDWPEATPSRWSAAAELADADLWAARNSARSRLVDFARRRLTRSITRRRGESAAAWCETALDPSILTIGFARRFATYKRATLLLRHPDRLRALLTDPDRPVQLLFAGKAHPADQPGKGLLQAIASFGDDPDLRDRLVFLEDYDIDAGRLLTQGCDVWLNTPLRPLEACGTSGMKAALNGNPNCSVQDGWWDECYTNTVGWAIPSFEWIEDPEERDRRESEWLFELIEGRILPSFYRRSDAGIPEEWTQRMKAILIGLGPRVSAARMVADYTGEYYEPLAARSRAIATDDYAPARDLAAWKRRIRGAWGGVQISDVVLSTFEPPLGTDLEVTANVQLGEVDDDDVRVELLSGPLTNDGVIDPSTTTPMVRVADSGPVTFLARVACENSGAFGYAVRVVPAHPHLGTWQELSLISWGQRTAG